MPQITTESLIKKELKPIEIKMKHLKEKIETLEREKKEKKEETYKKSTLIWIKIGVILSFIMGLISIILHIWC